MLAEGASEKVSAGIDITNGKRISPERTNRTKWAAALNRFSSAKLQ